MVLPTLFVGVQAIRTNALERGTLETLGQRLARSRTYADVEDAMFNQTQVIWRYLGGDPTAKQEFPLTVQVVDFRFDRWTADLPPDEVKLADAVRRIEADIQAVAARVFQLHDAGQRDQAALVARRELLERLQPTLASVNREIYRQARELSVQGAVAQMRSIVEAKRRVLWATVFVALVAGLVASWLISRDLARPLTELRHAMAVVGAGDLEHTIAQAIVPRSSDEIGDLARAFARMTEQLRQSRAQLVQSEKLASIGQMAAAVAHGLRNPLASLRRFAHCASACRRWSTAPSRASRSCCGSAGSSSRSTPRPPSPTCRWTRCASSRPSRSSCRMRSTPCRRAAGWTWPRGSSPAPAARAVSSSLSPTQDPGSLPRFSPTCASRSSRRGPRGRVWGSRSRSATWRRRAAGSTSPARSAAVRPCGSGFPARAARSRPSRHGVSRERLDRAHRGRRAIAGALRQGVPVGPRLRGGGSGHRGAGAGPARHAATRRRVRRRPAAGDERARSAQADPRVRSGDSRRDADRLRLDRGRRGSGQARRLRLRQEAGGPGGAEAARRPRPRDAALEAGAVLLPPSRDDGRRLRGTGGGVAGGAGGARPGPTGRGAGRDATRAAHRRDRYRERPPGSRDPRRGSPRDAAVHRGQLLGAPRHAHGSRAVRS